MTGSHREDLLYVWEWSGIRPQCPGVVGRPSRMSGVVCRSSRMSASGREPSQMSGIGTEVL